MEISKAIKSGGKYCVLAQDKNYHKTSSRTRNKMMSYDEERRKAKNESIFVFLTRILLFQEYRFYHQDIFPPQ